MDARGYYASAMADYDARIVELYDDDNPNGPDHDFYRGLVARERAGSVLDLGCGTGILTVTLAAPHRRVVGVDPSPRMLAHAGARAGGESVAWVRGDSTKAPGGPFDVALMTGNVAQHIIGDHWTRTLRDVRERMPVGGLLAFESRNPARRAWEAWATAERATRSTRLGRIEEWYEARESSPGVVRVTAHTVFETSGDHVADEFDLAFRARRELERQLREAGFTVEAVHGDWRGSPFTHDDALLIVEARAV